MKQEKINSTELNNQIKEIFSSDYCKLPADVKGYDRSDSKKLIDFFVFIYDTPDYSFYKKDLYIVKVNDLFLLYNRKENKSEFYPGLPDKVTRFNKNSKEQRLKIVCAAALKISKFQNLNTAAEFYKCKNIITSESFLFIRPIEDRDLSKISSEPSSIIIEHYAERVEKILSDTSDYKRYLYAGLNLVYLPDYISFGLRELLELFSKLQKGEKANNLHDFRTLARRIRLLLKYFILVRDNQKSTKFLRTISKIQKLCNEARDIEVFIEFLKNDNSVFNTKYYLKLEKLFDKKITEALSKMGPLLNKLDVNQFFTINIDSQKSREIIIFNVTAGTGVLLTIFDTINQNSAIEEFHKLRIKVKYLRYSFEIFKDVLRGSNKKYVIVKLRELQNLLGGLNDMDCFESIVNKGRKKKFSQSEDETRVYLNKIINEKKTEISMAVLDKIEELKSGKFRNKILTLIK